MYTIADGTADERTPPSSPPPEHLPEAYGNLPQNKSEIIN
jgi:hypothetical protein